MLVCLFGLCCWFVEWESLRPFCYVNHGTLKQAFASSWRDLCQMLPDTHHPLSRKVCVSQYGTFPRYELCSNNVESYYLWIFVISCLACGVQLDWCWSSDQEAESGITSKKLSHINMGSNFFLYTGTRTHIYAYQWRISYMVQKHGKFRNVGTLAAQYLNWISHWSYKVCILYLTSQKHPSKQTFPVNLEFSHETCTPVHRLNVSYRKSISRITKLSFACHVSSST